MSRPPVGGSLASSSGSASRGLTEWSRWGVPTPRSPSGTRYDYLPSMNSWEGSPGTLFFGAEKAIGRRFRLIVEGNIVLHSVDLDPDCRWALRRGRWSVDLGVLRGTETLPSSRSPGRSEALSVRLSRTIERTDRPRRRKARSCSSAQICALDRRHDQQAPTCGCSDASERGAAYGGTCPRPHPDQRALTVVDLPFLAGRGGDDHPCFHRRDRAGWPRSGVRSHTGRQNRGRRPGPARWPWHCGHRPEPP